MTARLSIIVAIAENGVIGRDNGLPWRLPSDLRYFKSVTMGKPVIMGRKTFESIGRPLPGRDNIVVTRRTGFTAPDVTVAYSLDEAVTLAEGFARARGLDEVFIIGGAQIYAEALDRADRLYVTEVATAAEGNATFPEIDMGAWHEVSREPGERSEKDSAGFAFVVYERSSH
ncbi:dihydrofolate reductase [Microbaculum marinum]|uniref:Dihydrofolate reductase n=1 Tax=Microbaculum marinum TaxID=1764581 RepID=A0AAW9S189_9HYPH